MTRVYEEVVDFISRGTTSDAVAAWTPSQQARDEVAVLLAKNADGTISPQEKADLDHYLEIEHLMRLAKSRARSRVRG
jgi:hypothetical protein